MKNLVFGIIMLALFSSCKKEAEKVIQENEKSEVINPISEPNPFIGKNKTKAMVLGVFHFDNPGLDSYKEKFAFNILEEKRQKQQKRRTEWRLRPEYRSEGRQSSQQGGENNHIPGQPLH